MKNKIKEVILEFNLKGFDKKDIDVKLKKNSLVIKAIKKQKNKVQKKDFFHSEKSFKKFSYATTLPRINPDKTKIEFKKGILKITAPKE